MNWLIDRKPQVLILVGVLIICFAVYTVTREPEDFRDPSEIAEANLETLIEAARQRDIGPFEELLSDRVLDDQGRNKDDLVKTLRLLFFRHKNIHLNVVDLQSRETIPDEEVVTNLTLLMGEQAVTVDKGLFEVTFSREGTKWRVTQVKWGGGYGY